MAIFRINKTKNYTVMNNEHLRDKTLSLEAKGVLSIMIVCRIECSVDRLVSMSKDERSVVESALKELQEKGYIE